MKLTHYRDVDVAAGLPYLSAIGFDPYRDGHLRYTAMCLAEMLVAVWQQALVEGKKVVELGGESYSVKATRAKKLKTVQFKCGSYTFDGIEQNPQTGSRWAALAREGNRVIQFRCKGRYVANVCEGKLLRYPAWQALKLPE